MENSKVDSIVELAGQLAGDAEEIEDVLVIYTLKSGNMKSSDNGITASKSLWLLEAFKFWLMTSMAKEDD